jgi:hypothetical protein
MPPRTTAQFEANRQNRRGRYAAHKAQGKCAHCGERPPYEGFVSCLPCRAKFRDYQRHYTYRQREMRRQGLLPSKPEPVRCQCGANPLIACEHCQTPLCDTCFDVGEGQCRDCYEVVEVRPA